jgi:sugar transferase (PEP-CTERM/EpsH1 system associated)
VLAYCSGMARFAVEPPLSAYPLVVDLVDVDSEKWSALAPRVPWPKRWVYQREARCLSTFEHRLALHARSTLVVTQREAIALQRIAPGAAVRVVHNGVDLSTLKPSSPPFEAPHVVFCGVMNYAPNVDGVLWFARNVWPLVRARRPDARLFIVGSDPVASVRRLGSLDSGIEVTGTVPDVRRYLWNAAISVAPLRTARGIQNKVLEAVACGLPTVATSQVLEGLPDQVRSACRSADLPGAFAEETLALLAMSGSDRRAIAEGADLAGLSWHNQLAPLYDILANAATRSGG